MRTIWQNRFALLESNFDRFRSGSRPRRRVLADLGYHLALWLLLGFVYTFSAIYRIQWESPKRVESLSTTQSTMEQTAIGRHSREKRRATDRSDS